MIGSAAARSDSARHVDGRALGRLATGPLRGLGGFAAARRAPGPLARRATAPAVSPCCRKAARRRPATSGPRRVCSPWSATLFAALRGRLPQEWLRGAGILRSGGAGAADALAGELALGVEAGHSGAPHVAGLALDGSECYDRLPLRVKSQLARDAGILAAVFMLKVDAYGFLGASVVGWWGPPAGQRVGWRRDAQRPPTSLQCSCIAGRIGWSRRCRGTTLTTSSLWFQSRGRPPGSAGCGTSFSPTGEPRRCPARRDRSCGCGGASAPAGLVGGVRLCGSGCRPAAQAVAVQGPTTLKTPLRTILDGQSASSPITDMLLDVSDTPLGNNLCFVGRIGLPPIILVQIVASSSSPP